MHTRSKRYLRRQRARLRIAETKKATEGGDAWENRLALSVAKCLKKSRRAGRVTVVQQVRIQAET